MATETKIQWTDSTFNPWRGCTKIASGCTNCYADTLAKRNPKTLGVWGPNGTRVLASQAMWREPVKWNAEAEANDEAHRVFCASLADVFEDWQGRVTDSRGNVLQVSACKTGPQFTHGQLNPKACPCVTLDDCRAELFKLIDSTPWLTWQILTKRPENIRRMWPQWTQAGFESLNTIRRYNVHLLFSASDQQSLEAGADSLMGCRDLVPVLGLSLEPLVGPIDLSIFQDDEWFGPSWVIVGGESGPNARPCDVAWVRSIVEQCKAAGVPVFVKQLGQFPILPSDTVQQHRDRTAEVFLWPEGTHIGNPTGDESLNGRCLLLKDKKGGDISEWPDDLKVREFPKVN